MLMTMQRWSCVRNPVLEMRIVLLDKRVVRVRFTYFLLPVYLF